MEKWIARRGTAEENRYTAPAEMCMLLDFESTERFKPSHGDFARIIVRMSSEEKDDVAQLKRLTLILAAPELERLLQEMLDAFVPTIRSQLRLTQAQGSVSVHARELLACLKGDK